MNDLFANTESNPPAIIRLRSNFDRAKAELETAEAHADESGESVPSQLRMDYNAALVALRDEERRLAKEGK